MPARGPRDTPKAGCPAGGIPSGRMQDDLRRRRARRRPRLPALSFRPRVVIPILIGLVLLLRVVWHYGAELYVRTLFFESLGMGDAFATRWQLSVVLALAGILLAALIALPLLLLTRSADAYDEPTPIIPDNVEAINWESPAGRGFGPEGRTIDRNVLTGVLWVGWGILTFLLALMLGGGLARARDPILAAINAKGFGADDPVFGHDIAFHVFVVPMVTEIVGLLVGALILAGIAVLGLGFGLALVERQNGNMRESRAAFHRTARIAAVMGGLLMFGLAILLWFSRYEMTVGPDLIVAGAGAAARDIDIPTRAVAAVVMALLGLAIVALASERVRNRIEEIERRRGATILVAIWAVIVVALTLVASPWWLVLLVPVAAGAALVRGSGQAAWARRASPVLAVPAFAIGSAAILGAIGPIGAQINDATVLRGSALQVERENIEATLVQTRAASGIDQAQVIRAPYRQNGVTREAIEEVPAAVDSIRFLDIPPTIEACQRIQARNQFYHCEDVDVDRYEIDGERRTVFAIGREVDYSRPTDFQRRHFTFTHGFGLIVAPVDEIDDEGRPKWIAGGIDPVRSFPPEITRPEIYFGAQGNTDWVMVNTDQPTFDGLSNRPVEWEGATGIRVGGGLRRLAITEYLGGLPYIGGGRQVWNATSGRPADADSELLLFRDMRARMAELAPFLTVDDDPYFVSAQGRLWVMGNAYVETDRYPYAARFGGVNYRRLAAITVMDAYSGDTTLYVPDPDEPMTRTWRAAYPSLFTDLEEMPDALREHIRYGEDLFDFQARAVEFFHLGSGPDADPEEVRGNAEIFFSGDAAWAPTEEVYGAGVQGERIVSPARFTFAVLPGQKSEEFLAIRSYKPRVQGRGIGFTGWFAASSDPENFGKLTILKFPVQGEPLDSLDTFTANVARDPELSRELTVRSSQIRRGNTLVVPVGEGLLYVQPLYLDSDDSLPILFKVVVSFGDNQVYAADRFEEALRLALLGARGASGGEDGAGAPDGADLEELVRRAAREFEAYQAAFGRGRR